MTWHGVWSPRLPGYVTRDARTDESFDSDVGYSRGSAMVNWEAIQANADLVAANGQLLAEAAKAMDERKMQEHRDVINRSVRRIDDLLRDYR